MGLSEGALSGLGEEWGAGLCTVRPGQFLSGQAGIGRNMRIDLPAGWEGMRKSPHSDEENLVDEPDVTRLSQ